MADVRVDFYHLTRDPAPPVAAQLAQRVLGSGARLLLVAQRADERQALDDALWSAQPDSFLPHPAADAAPIPADAQEPILIAADCDAPPANGARIVALADGHWRDGALGFERVLLLFDGRVIDDARALWRRLGNAAGVNRHYWKQDEQGRWREGP